MPHCILEYSANVVDEPDRRQVMLEIHEVMVATGRWEAADIKSRAVRHDEFVVGDGAADRAFVTLDIQILAGRDDAVKEKLAEGVLAILERHYPRTLAECRCSFSVQVTDMHSGSYRRLITYED